MSDAPFKPFPIAPPLEKAEFSAVAKQALMELDAAMFQWHRKLAKGELTGRLLAETDLDLEPALFQALMAVMRITHGVGRPAAQEPTVGLLAEELSIDPSRASRIASELITRGYIERAAAQDDGRKSVLLLTKKGRAAFETVRDLRWSHMVDMFSDWTESDIERFSDLFGRYVAGVLSDLQTEDEA
ncbi:MarR family winged helix-turn-helix transcriptional regulator [Maritimibacter sp. UBA3975]|uniref:MarR family winged helix-turn-helix transcriptional regulator n=1 Tax=Maritimibacter sp. UBA3975 TaxID=1946833 RepID=UPI000C0B932B|nr:MarR family winged helix-turn-helix transcriptional regulator [Maritimibacter sp. UBA3975]MAM60896.1 MarR family transcriptional regulator [Maritimibacter sp.]|tara:strand:+ start:14724 stop:15281 length:558 start_codon:yes stop_codon:yes gene_type:complete